MTAAAPPLAGVRVLDVASLYAAPLIATFLADHGADVVKVEPPEGDGYRRDSPALWALVGRGKRSLTLDLGTAEGCDLLRRLLPHFDVIVENWPLRLARQRGLTPEEMRAVNPAMVVVSASGFGHDGPYAGRPANGTLGEAFAGLTHLTGDPDGPPMLPSVPLGDAVGAAFGAMGALAALVGQLRTGAGAHVDVTVFEPILHLLGPALTGHAVGSPPPLRDGGDMGVVLRGTFATADGRWVAIGCGTPRHAQSVVSLVGGGDGQPLRARAAAWIAARKRDDVLDAMLEARIPVVPVNDLADVIADPHVQARGSLLAHGDGVVAAPAPRVAGSATTIRFPELGDANADLLGDLLGLGDDDIRSLQHRGVVA